MAEKNSNVIIKLSPQEIKDLVDLRTDISNLYVQIGQLYLQRKETLDEFDKKEIELLSDKETLIKRENELYNKMGDKYGHGDINLETGVFTPINTK